MLTKSTKVFIQSKPITQGFTLSNTDNFGVVTFINKAKMLLHLTHMKLETEIDYSNDCIECKEEYVQTDHREAN